MTSVGGQAEVHVLIEDAAPRSMPWPPPESKSSPRWRLRSSRQGPTGELGQVSRKLGDAGVNITSRTRDENQARLRRRRLRPLAPLRVAHTRHVATGRSSISWATETAT
jgi:hypothetical protein